jgi:hypothetical protein
MKNRLTAVSRFFVLIEPIQVRRHEFHHARLQIGAVADQIGAQGRDVTQVVRFEVLQGLGHFAVAAAGQGVAQKCDGGGIGVQEAGPAGIVVLLGQVVQQLIGSATDSDSAKRQKRYRERKKEETLQSVTENVTQRNASVTNNNESKRKRIDKDKELEKEREDINNSCEQVAEKYAALCPSLPPLEIISDSIKSDLLESIEKYGVEKFDLLFKKAEASAFLKGENKLKWAATFDWLIKADNMAKVLNGNFDNKAATDDEYAKAFETLVAEGWENKERPKTAAECAELQAKVAALKEKISG